MPVSTNNGGSWNRPLNELSLLDFRYPASDVLHGVIEGGMPNGILDIAAAAAPIGASLTGHGDLRFDCRHACHRWSSMPRELGHLVRQEGGVGIDKDAFTADYRLSPTELRSGYREDDGQVHRHFWLLLGAGGHLFDPAAHQFDARGGVAADRYVLGGIASLVDAAWTTGNV